MTVLLAVPVVAVIVVILIAVFLRTRMARGDYHAEPEARTGARDRRRFDQERWQEREGSARASGRAYRPDQQAAGSAPDRRAVARRGAPGYGDRDGRPQGRDHASRTRGLDAPSRRSGRPDGEMRPGGYESATSRRAAPARARPEARTRYDSQPSPRVAVDGFPSADYPSIDFPSQDFPSQDFSQADYPSGDDRGGSGGHRPGAGTGSNAGPDAHGPRRTPAKGPAHGEAGSNKGRSRPHRGRRDDDDDWPSTEWDKLSDEQYWAELSADKPLASMNQPSPAGQAKPAPAKKAPPAKIAAPRPGPAAQDPRPGKPPSPGRGADRDVAVGTNSAAHQESVTERLPIRRPQRPAALAPAAPPRAAAETAPGNPAAPASPQRQGDASLAVLADLGTLAAAPPAASAPPAAPPARDDPLTSPSFSRTAAASADSRSYGNSRENGWASAASGQAGERKPSGGRHRAATPDEHPSGPYPAAPAQHPSGPYPVPAQLSNGGYRAAEHPSGPYPAVPPKHSSGVYPAPQHPNGAHPASQHPSGPYPAGGHAPGNGHDALSATSSGSWYNVPAEHEPTAPPVSYAGAARTPGGFAEGQGGAAYSGYGGDPAGDYPQPAYPAQPYPEQAGYATGPHDAADRAPHPGGYPEPPGYWDGQGRRPGGRGSSDYAEYGAEPRRGHPYGG